MKRVDVVNAIYSACDEDMRLTKSRSGQLKSITTMRYIHALLPERARVLEVGAGTGRYSVALAREGYDVSAVELVERNLETLRENAKGLENLSATQGDATNLGAFPDDAFDAVLALGPMYHLHAPEEWNRALDEAIRVTKPGGLIFTAFLSVYAILYANCLSGNFREGLAENFDGDFRVRHFEEQGFTGFDISEFEALFDGKPVRKIALAGTDSVLELAKQMNGFSLPDEEFEAFVRDHLHTCEIRELLGSHSHLLHICRKQDGRTNR